MRKKEILISKNKISNDIDFNSSGYIVVLFLIFKNDDLFCIKEKNI